MNSPFSRAFGCLVDSEAQKFYAETAYLHTGLTITALFALGKFFYQAGQEFRDIVEAYRQQSAAPVIASNNVLSGFTPRALLSPAQDCDHNYEPTQPNCDRNSEPTTQDYANLSYRELQSICKVKGLSAKGSKAALLKRLWES